MIRRIRTEQAPSAKPVSVSRVLTTDWQMIADAPEYDIPVVGFGTTRRIAPGVAEISSPLLVANVGIDGGWVDVLIRRGERALIVGQDHTAFSSFTTGNGYTVGSELTMNNGAEITVDAVDGTGGVTEFTVTASGQKLYPDDTIGEVLSSAGLGTGFTVTVQSANLESGDFLLTNQFPVEPRDTVMVPLNGQFLQTGDQLLVRANDNDLLHATLSYTEGQSEEDDQVTDLPGAI